MDENPRIADLRKKLEKDPGSRLFAQLAEELRKEGRPQEAIEVAQSGLERNPNYPSARLTLARALVDAGRPGEARPELEQIVRTAPDNILAGRLLADVLEALNEAPLALRQLEQTVKLAPGDKGLQEKMADLQRRTGEMSRKAAEFAAASPPPLVVPEPSPVQVLPSVFEDAAPVSSLRAGLPQAPSVARVAPPQAAQPVPPPGSRPVTPAAPRGAGTPSASAPRSGPPPVPTAPVAAAKPGAPGPASTTPRPSGALPPAPKSPAPAAPARPASAQPNPSPTVNAAPPAPKAPLASEAFDRDLASGTFSPGSLNATQLQEHFEAVAAAERMATAPPPAAFKTVPHTPALPAPFPDMDTADTVTLEPALEASAAPDEPEFPSIETPADIPPEDSDVGGRTVPLSSMTLAELYLQQGLKKEASAVLSQVLREEPHNALARSRFAEATEAPAEEVKGRQEAAATALPLPAPTPAPTPAVVQSSARSRPTRAQIRDKMIHDLRAFEGAAEREAQRQRATEQGVF